MTELMVIAACVALVVMVGSLHRAASIRRFARDLEFQLALERSGVDEAPASTAGAKAALSRFETERAASDDNVER